MNKHEIAALILTIPVLIGGAMFGSIMFYLALCIHNVSGIPVLAPAAIFCMIFALIYAAHYHQISSWFDKKIHQLSLHL